MKIEEEFNLRICLPRGAADRILEDLGEGKLLVIHGDDWAAKSLIAELERQRIPYKLESEITEISFYSERMKMPKSSELFKKPQRR